MLCEISTLAEQYLFAHGTKKRRTARLGDSPYGAWIAG